MRNPFSMPAGCDPVSFDINIIPVDFPLCSIPVFIAPQVCNHEFPIPEIPIIPPYCACLGDIATTPESIVKLSGDTLSMSIGIVAGTAVQDCCAPCYNISYNFNMPCLPKEVSVASTAGVITGSQPTLALALVKKADCAGLKLSYALNIPCFPKSISNVKGAIVQLEGNSGADMAINLTKLSCCAGLKISYCMQIPCYPKTVSVVDGGVVVSSVSGGGNASLNIGLVRKANCDGLKLSYDMRIAFPKYGISVPCMPNAISVVKGAMVAIERSGPPSANVDIGLVKTTGCNIKLSYALQIGIQPGSVGPIGPTGSTGPIGPPGSGCSSACSGISINYGADLSGGCGLSKDVFCEITYLSGTDNPRMELAFWPDPNEPCNVFCQPQKFGLPGGVDRWEGTAQQYTGPIQFVHDITWHGGMFYKRLGNLYIWKGRVIECAIDNPDAHVIVSGVSCPVPS